MKTELLSLISKGRRSDFVKVTSMSAVATLVKMLASFVTIKIVAKVIGPAGIALVGQFINAVSMIGSVGTGGINQGVTKLIAENKENKNEQGEIIRHSFLVTVFSTLITALMLFLFNRKAGSIIFHTHEYDVLIIVLALALVLYTFNLLLLSILNGFMSFRKYIFVNIFSSILILIVSVALVFFFGLCGALLNCVVSQTIVIFVTLWYVRKEDWFPLLFGKIKLKQQVFKKLGAFSAMAFTSALLFPITQIIIRSNIIDKISLQSAGIWEGMNRFSGMYLMVVTTSISTYYLPRLSGIKENREIRKEIFKTAKIVLPVLAFGCLIFFILRNTIISLVFTKEFTEMRYLFAVQMIGDFLKVGSWLVSFLFFAKSRTVDFIIAEVIANASMVGFSLLFISQFGLVGGVYGYATAYFIYFLVVLYMFRKIIFVKNEN